MNCKECQRRIVEEFAAGKARGAGEVVAHRESCGACREFYDGQAALFQRIDAGMHELANAPLPASLLARTRNALEAQSARSAVPLWSYGLLAAACALVLGFAYVHRRPDGAQSTNAAPVVAEVGGSLAEKPEASPMEEIRPKNDVRRTKKAIREADVTATPASREGAGPDLQLVVSESERRAFLRLAAAASRGDVSVLARAPQTKPEAGKAETPVEIALLKMGDVDLEAVHTEVLSMK